MTTSTRYLYRLVPDEVTIAHERARAATRLPGVVDARNAVAVADDVLLEVAACLAGREPTGDAQVEYVAEQVRRLDDLTAALEERGDVWRLAKAELDAMGPVLDDPPSAGARDGRLVGVLVVLLSPFFVAWDLVRGVVRGAVLLVDGAIAAWSSVIRWVGDVAVGAARAVLAATRRWREYRDRIAGALREARARVVAARLRLRLRLRRRRRLHGVTG